MRCGLHVASCGEYADARTLAELARQAEVAGWDGFFIWDHMSMSPPEPQADPWVALAAIALNTEHLRIGTMVTPLARRRPWEVARETVTLDRLSGGRLVLGVGLGDSAQEYEQFGLPADPKARAAMLDEALHILTGLWSGEAFTYDGKYHRVSNALFTPAPLQHPRIPIWIGGFWPNKGPFRRAARYDGVFAGTMSGDMTPDDLREMLAFVRAMRSQPAAGVDPEVTAGAGTTFDVVVMNATPGDQPEEAARIVAPYAAAGATWWFEPIHSWRGSFEEMRTRIAQGPPASTGDS
jgi:alkanesulfonate monooxygenase SsuD/methylene tetrahydromethanopterin reductase-like flavin-dependent oxidoreductase (luciferase family)